LMAAMVLVVVAQVELSLDHGWLLRLECRFQWL